MMGVEGIEVGIMKVGMKSSNPTSIGTMGNAAIRGDNTEFF